ncbi:MAG TPA: SurA N-terminal domain-containing protein [Anaeromyxobacteraceae bacterium]|jgi:peptidyl-prolyl cis-trans isomerase D|nr:SurA N-terminal domain-containing protein [Anaeromyxobacteraceae bacterium]
MLDILRANARSVLTYVLFGIIIVVFVVSFGPGSRGCSDSNVRQASYAAKVNGDTVTAADFEQHYAQLFRLYQARAGQAFSRELADQLGLRKVAMDQLIERELVLQQADKHGVAVSDDELSRSVKENPAFQTDGRFDYDLYKRAVTNYFGSPSKYEERLRRDLAYGKMLALLRETAKVSDDEIKEAWLSESDRVNLEFVRFPYAALKAEQKPADAQVQAFLQGNGPRIEKFYKDNAARYDLKKRVRARHILVKADEKAAKAVDEDARKRAEAVKARVEKGEDFAKVAQETSDDPGSKDRGGELGLFGPGVMAKPFEDAAFGARPGAVVGPIRTRFGWHVIQTEEVQEPKVIPLEQARADIARELLQGDMARHAALARAEEGLAKARKTGKPLAELFPAGKDQKNPFEQVAVETTGLFGATAAAVPRIGPAPALAGDAFKANAGELLAKVYETPQGPVIAKVKERQRPDPAKFEAVKEDLSSRLRDRKQSQAEQAWVKSLRAEAKVKVNDAFTQGNVAAPNVDLD